jgi:hypothetical protein
MYETVEYERNDKKQEASTFKKTPHYYPSNTPDTFIRNAVTGMEYPWKTGTVDAQRLFKIVDATGRYDRTGVKLKSTAANYPNSNTNHCYYDSPLQYMTHTRNVVNPAFLEQWSARQSLFTESDNIGQ